MMKQDKLKALSERLRRLQLDLSNERGRVVNQDELAKYISRVSGKRISAASLSHWIRGRRLPEGHSIDALQYVIPDIYDILDLPQFVPSSMALRKIGERWPKLSPEERAKIMTIIEGDQGAQMALTPVS